MLVAGLLALQANLSDPARLEEGLLLTALALFLAFIVYWVVALLRALPIPKQ